MTKVTLISGSTMGSAEYVAEHMAEILEELGYETEVQHGPDLDSLPREGLWLVVSSTHGAGDLPENIQPLAEQIESQSPDLSQVQFGSVGIGSSEYDTFCGAIHKLSRLLVDHGAKRIGEPLEIDVQQHEIPEDPAGEWVKIWAKEL
ncbi:MULTISPECIES: FMN-binding protein MioC [Providencia]|uniref:FMN-binding protein MioC n=1 Tax=Providencia TaxID=586 RepID=UPI00073CDE32|nr:MULTISPECIES: FMN-binding protein MioC [Providencia]SST04893.1 bifunctional sulfite reductase flavoprotein alpha-component/iron-uptake factor [Acinetobacter baumannii]KSX98165.1 FMN-binding protein [Providencia stuartii]MCX3070614.1 FMN-binding protein MioC [Providencia stuartii]MDT1068126.1 FMN-binding protein MioC [Providencia stuartii]MDT2015117.1 FMN-binding protein MioC [Providencia stuartii]